MTFSRDPVFLPLRDMDTSVCFRQPLVIVLPSCYNSRTSMTFWLLLVAYDHDANQWVIVIIALNAPFLNQRHGTDIQTNRGTKIWGGEDQAGSPFNTSHLGRGLAPYQVTSGSMQPLGRNRYGPKIGGCAPLEKGELGPHLTLCGQCRSLPACQVSS